MLAAACCLIALGIGIYVNTVTSPPRQLNYPDQYKADVSADINMLTAATDTVSTDSLFFSILHKIDFEQSQQKYDGTARDGLVTQFIDGYVPKFIRDCHRSFNASVWHQSDHRRMLTRIDELMAITVDSGNAKAVGARADSLENIRTVISPITKPAGWQRRQNSRLCRRQTMTYGVRTNLPASIRCQTVRSW